jgi:hypothetical protein
MTFEETMQTIYSIFCKNIGNAETIELCRELEKPLKHFRLIMTACLRKMSG